MFLVMQKHDSFPRMDEAASAEMPIRLWGRRPPDPPGSDNRALRRAEQRGSLRVEQHDQGVDAESRTEWEAEKVQRADDDGQDGRPRPELEQTDPGDDAGKRDDYQEDHDRRADGAGDEHRLALTGDRAGAENEDADDDPDHGQDAVIHDETPSEDGYV